MTTPKTNDTAADARHTSPTSGSALHDHAVELWNMATKASIRSFNQEWSDERVETETDRFIKRLGEIISQNVKERDAEKEAYE